MSHDDNKALYSEASKYYVQNHEAEKAFGKSKEREEKHDKSWSKNKVNLNEIIDKFAPKFEAKKFNSKMIFFGEKYNVVADMASGYLRIYDNEKKVHVKLDGTPGNDKNTHFKILKREEM